MTAVITLTTDFGLADAYVAAMKGIILGINPEAKLIDICHTIKPQNILEGAFVLSTAYSCFPPQTIHLVVIDPGVGTEREAVILKTPTAYFVAPDNGVLSYVMRDYSTQISDAGQAELGAELEAVAFTEPKFWRTPVSPTFHGRDIFAPVAAWLSLGVALTDFGKSVSSLKVLPLSHPCSPKNNLLVGHILHADNFGNLITDIRSNDLPETKEELEIEVSRQFISGLSRTYAEGKELLALIGSSGYLEISVKEGNARASLNAHVGDEVKVKRLKKGGE